MTLFHYGKWHVWFAWKPVNTGAYGWRWLCRVYRRRWYGDVIGCPDGWEYLPMWRESLAPGLYRRVTPDELGGE